MKHFIFFVVTFIVTAPVILGLMTDSLGYSFGAVVYGAAWYCIFTYTKVGRKLLRKGYKIACSIMGDCDV